MEKKRIEEIQKTEAHSDIGRAIESIERSAFDRATKENVRDDETARRISDGYLLQGPEDQNYVPMGKCSLKDVLVGMPPPSEEEIKAAEEEIKAAEEEIKAAEEEQKHPIVYTVEDVKEKLEEELKIYKDGDSKYVVDRLIELCATDESLINAIMLPHKSYDKAFQYFYEQSRSVGYKMPSGNMVYLDNDKAVELSVEYFKRDDSAVSKKKATEKKTVKKKQTSGATKNSCKPVVQPKTIAKKDEEKNKSKSGVEGQFSLFDFL